MAIDAGTSNIKALRVGSTVISRAFLGNQKIYDQLDYPTLDLNFALTKTLDPRVTFTRASTATYFDSAGVLRSAAINEPRFDYNPATLVAQGLLIEDQRTNLLLQSEDLSTTWAATGSTVSTNATTAPSGAATADKLIANSAISVSPTSVAAFVRQNITKAASATTYTFSVFAKAGEFNAIRILAADNATSANNAAVSALLTNGTVLTAAAAAGTFTNASVAITNVGNGWYRVALTFTSSTETAIRFIYAVNNSSPTQGDASKGIFIWGAQLEVGAFPTSYIPTTTTALTRAADVAVMTGTNFSSWYNASEGTVVAQSSNFSKANFPVVASINDNTINNRINTISSTTTTNRLAVATGSVTQAEFAFSNYVTGTIVNHAFAIKANDFAGSVNGATVQTDTSGTMPTVTQLQLGAQEGGLFSLNGHIRRITYFNRRLANSELQLLSS
jgi:hypothetical protein